MLRRILFITLFLIPTLFSVAQNQVKTISGELIDQEMKEAVVQAAIQLFTTSDSTFVGGKTDTEGRYDKKWGNADSRNR